jgi:tRNA-dihydrouridine synthase 3
MTNGTSDINVVAVNAATHISQVSLPSTSLTVSNNCVPMQSPFNVSQSIFHTDFIFGCKKIDRQKKKIMSSSSSSSECVWPEYLERFRGLTGEQMMEAGISPVKPEYWDFDAAKREKKAREQREQTRKRSVDQLSSSSSSSSSPSLASKRQRVGFTKSDRSKMLCPKSAINWPCDYGERCQFMHDVDAYLASRSDDLQGKCPQFEALGYCYAGYKCRYLGSHLGDDNKLTYELTDERFHGRQPVDGKARIALERANKKRPWKDRRNGRDADTVEVFLRQKEADMRAQRNIENAVDNDKEKESVDKEEERVDAIDDDDDDDDEPSVASSSSNEVDDVPLRAVEHARVDFRDKLILAPLTTTGNLPFRKVCKRFGADITVSEMALGRQLLQGSNSEWSLMRRDACEDVFGVQLAGCQVSEVVNAARAVMALGKTPPDFIDLNCGCPIDTMFKKGLGSALLNRKQRMQDIMRGLKGAIDVPVTIKVRMGVDDGKPNVHEYIGDAGAWGASAITIHGRSREQRYTRPADWSYVGRCVKLAGDLPVIGNGDVYNWRTALDWKASSGVSSLMLARGALIKPWLFAEIKERRDWDISAPERLDMIGGFCRSGMTLWGSDDRGIANTRRFLLEWLSFTYRYVPIGIAECVPSSLQLRPPTAYVGRSDLETQLASDDPLQWIRLTEMFLGKAPEGFTFTPKHRANSYTVVI